MNFSLPYYLVIYLFFTEQALKSRSILCVILKGKKSRHIKIISIISAYQQQSCRKIVIFRSTDSLYNHIMNEVTQGASCLILELQLICNIFYKLKCFCYVAYRVLMFTHGCKISPVYNHIGIVFFYLYRIV